MVGLGCGAFTSCSIQVLDAHAKNYIERAWKKIIRKSLEKELGKGLLTGLANLPHHGKPIKHNQCTYSGKSLKDSFLWHYVRKEAPG